MLEAVGEVYPNAKYQRCTVHFYHDVFSVVPRSKVKQVAKMIKAIHAQESNCARLRHVAGAQWDSKKYMNMKHLETAFSNAYIA